jgi:hypothetical protein
MIQIYFISPTGAQAVQKALLGIRGQRTHGWRPDGDDKQVIGVVEITGKGDPEEAADALEAAGIMVLPDHKTDQALDSTHVAALKQHGIAEGDTTKVAMTKIHTIAGFPPIKPKRF